MRNTIITAVAALAAFSVTALGSSGEAAAAPSGFGNAQDTINALQSQGFNVVLNGAAVYPLSGCKVTGIEGLNSSNVDSSGRRIDPTQPSTWTFHAGADNRNEPWREPHRQLWHTVRMAQITLRGNPINTVGELPAVGSPAPRFTLTGTDLGAVTSEQFHGKPLLLNIFPSVDTPVCATSVRTFNERAEASGLSVLCVSKDLPFAQKRFCGAEGIENVITASAFRDSFGDDFGITIVDGPMAGLLARAVVVIGADGNVAYTELVPEIAAEPSYDAGLSALGASD